MESCCRDEVIIQQESDLELSVLLPDREEGEVNQEKRTDADTQPEVGDQLDSLALSWNYCV